VEKGLRGNEHGIWVGREKGKRSKSRSEQVKKRSIVWLQSVYGREAYVNTSGKKG